MSWQLLRLREDHKQRGDELSDYRKKARVREAQVKRLVEEKTREHAHLQVWTMMK